ncbi:hypothetical protein ACFYYM_27640 [Streptomyces erythrochromogenes]|uniref:hypothetical protein n=1 Tax=Streptomyces erythrochromogenes TaxID=285574 RepID=UPI0036B9F278
MSGTNAQNAAGSFWRAREYGLPRTSTAGMGAVAAGEVFRLSGERAVGGGGHVPPAPDTFERFEGTDWTGFAQEYPGVDCSGRRYEDRMPALLEKTFGEGAR